MDMWSVGLAVQSPLALLHLRCEISVLTARMFNKAWDLLDEESLFRIYDQEDQEENELHHLANMVALLGPPPRELLGRSSKSKKYWDAQGKQGVL